MDAVLALVALLVPVALGSALIVLGLGRRWAPWPWLVGAGVATVPAFYMATVKLCDRIAGTCISGDELSNSRHAVASLIAFAAAAVLPAARRRRTRARDLAFAALVLVGELWLLLRLLEAGEVPAVVLIIALIATGLGYEAVARTRMRAGRAAT